MCTSLLVGPHCSLFFFFNDPATTEIYTLSLHDALPISRADAASCSRRRHRRADRNSGSRGALAGKIRGGWPSGWRLPSCFSCEDRKSTRLNSSHLVISYAVFCLKKKTYDYTQAVIASYT